MNESVEAAADPCMRSTGPTGWQYTYGWARVLLPDNSTRYDIGTQAQHLKPKPQLLRNKHTVHLCNTSF
jgi:hypothetical protein